MQKLFWIAAITMALVSTAFATNLSLYEKPDTSSKVIATLHDGDAIIPIFYPEKSEWVKIGNSKNGDVGWVKLKDLHGPVIVSQTNGQTIKQQIISDGKQPEDVKIIQYTASAQFNQKDIDRFTKELEVKQKQIHDSLEKLQIDMQKSFQDLMQGVSVPAVNVTVERTK